MLTEWRNRVRAEYRSAARTAQLLHWMVLAGFPRELLTTAGRIVQDELDHADLSFDCVVAMGGEAEPAAMEVGALSLSPSQDGLLASIVDVVGHDFCLGETLAVPLFRAMWEHTTAPSARLALTRVLRDEAVHRAFGWQALDALLDLDGPGTRARVEALLPTWLGDFEAAYADGRVAPPLSAAERSAGLIDLAVYRDVFHTTTRGDIRRRFARRGISWIPTR
ncbi:MAG: hypothetical protein ACI8PZ_006184 [Myxococcota bacterium]